MLFCNRSRHAVFASLATLSILLLVLVPRQVHAQDDSGPKEDGRHGRKYKAPPQTSDIEVTVLKGFNKKPVANAAVVFHPVDADGKDEGSMEMKTDPDGKAKIDVIPTGSSVRIQVIATGYATYAGDYKIDTPQRNVTIDLQRPHEQMSTYVDETGKPSSMQPGVQEPVRPKLSKTGIPIPQSSPNSAATGSSKSGAQGSSSATSSSKQQ